MDQLQTAASALIRSAGDLWFAAVIAAFVVMVCESAKPKPSPGEPKDEPGGVGLLAMILSLVTPLLLMIHAFMNAGRAPPALLGAVVVIATAVVAAALVGWAIASRAAPVGRSLSRAAPYLAVAVFALTLWISWRSAIELVHVYVLGAAGA